MGIGIGVAFICAKLIKVIVLSHNFSGVSSSSDLRDAFRRRGVKLADPASRTPAPLMNSLRPKYEDSGVISDDKTFVLCFERKDT